MWGTSTLFVQKNTPLQDAGSRKNALGPRWGQAQLCEVTVGCGPGSGLQDSDERGGMTTNIGVLTTTWVGRQQWPPR